MYGYEGPVSWELTAKELKAYVDEFRRAVDRVEKEPYNYREGSWCNWCKAKSICPLKQDAKYDKAKKIFSRISIESSEKDE